MENATANMFKVKENALTFFKEWQDVNMSSEIFERKI